MNYEEFVASVNKLDTLEHAIIGLAAEAGEVAGLLQKSMYKQQPINIEKLILEAGDVLFYLTALAGKLNVSMVELQQQNMAKLTARARLNQWDSRPE